MVSISPVGRVRLLILCALVAVLSIAALVMMWWVRDQPGRGISKADAVSVAWEHVDKGAVRVSSVALHQHFQTGFDIPVHQWAWVVTFSGQWHLLCGGAPCDPTSERVAIDYSSGDWIASQYSYPGGP